MSDTRGMATTKVGDRIRITAAAHPGEASGHVVGAEHVVVGASRSLSGAIVVDVGDDLPALVSSIGDRWTVLDGADPGAAA